MLSEETRFLVLIENPLKQLGRISCQGQHRRFLYPETRRSYRSELFEAPYEEEDSIVFQLHRLFHCLKGRLESELRKVAESMWLESNDMRLKCTFNNLAAIFTSWS